jgi:hypothetical protein
LNCESEGYGYFYDADAPAETTLHAGQKDKFERSTDYAINPLYVLGLISMGDGCSEAGRLLGLLGLPNDTTMESRSFAIIEQRLGPVIKELCDETIRNNLIEEVRLTMEASDAHSNANFELWKDSLTNDTLLPESKIPATIDGSFDMAWQQKGSGHKYDSQSGHGCIVGHLTRKVVALSIKCKLCNFCSAFRKKVVDVTVDVPPHECWKNHTGTSGSMEAASCLELVVSLFNDSNTAVGRLCCDDDSSVRADCQWRNADDYLVNNTTTVLPLVPKKVGINKGELQVRPDKGKLPANVPEPLFVADPNHRRKGLSGQLIKMDLGKVSEKVTMIRMDSTHITKNFAYMARTIRDKEVHEYEDCAKAVLEHHFDNHQ